MEKEKIIGYFERIGLSLPEKITADGELLEKIFHAHVTHVPYENIDFLNFDKQAITIGLLYRHVVTEKRGGVCFDLNALLGEVLNTLGYEAYPVIAKHYRTHMENTEYCHSALIVKDGNGTVWLTDVGDSFSGALKPLLLIDGVIQYPGNEAYLLKKQPDGAWMLYVRLKDTWTANYAFFEKPASLKELTYYKRVGMDPDIPFTHDELFHIRTDSGYRILRGHTYCEKNGAEKTVRIVEDEAMEKAYGCFGLKYPYTVYKDCEARHTAAETAD